MIPKLIKSEAEYEAALERVDALMDAESGTPELDELELWVHLIQAYEEKTCPIPVPDPVAAIKFKMEQSGLRSADLVPFIGTKGRVSEILNRRRPLTLAMIRKLHEGLSIPAELLIGEAQTRPSSRFDQVDWRTFPLKEIVKRGWFGDVVASSRELRQRAEELLGGLILASEAACPGLVPLRLSPSADREQVAPALTAWKGRVWDLARQEAVDTSAPTAIDRDFISEVVRLSFFDRGPLLAREMLAKTGIRFVVERQLPGTRLDGAVMRCTDGSAIVALTLRYDRLDHFWFTLCHELAHLALHVMDSDSTAILDDFSKEDEQEAEVEANRLAEDAMIPSEEWSQFVSHGAISKADILVFAQRQRLHPSIVAGRYQRQTHDYSQFRSLLGNGKVRSLFLPKTANC